MDRGAWWAIVHGVSESPTYHWSNLAQHTAQQWFTLQCKEPWLRATRLLVSSLFKTRKLSKSTSKISSNFRVLRLATLAASVSPGSLLDMPFLGHYPATATAKSLQSCLTLCDPIDSSPPGSPIPGILQARRLEWVAISFSNAWKWKVKVK